MTTQDFLGELSEELTRVGHSVPAWRLGWARWRFNAQRRADFYRELAVLLDREQRLTKALANLYAVDSGCEYLEEVTARPLGGLFATPLVVLIPHWLARLAEAREGENAGTILADGLPAREAQLLRAFAQSGLAGARLRMLAGTVLKQRSWGQQLRRSVWPLAVMMAVILVALYALAAFLPGMLKSMPKVQLASGANDLLALAEFVTGNGPWLLTAAAGIPALVWWSLDRLTGPLRRWLDRVPPWSVYRRWTGAGWLQGMAALIGAERPIPEALALLRDGASPYIAERLDALLADDDRQLGEALLRSGFGWPDRRTIRAIIIHLSADRPEDGLAELADEEIERLGALVTDFADWVSYGGQIFIGLLVGWLIWASYGLYSSFIPM